MPMAAGIEEGWRRCVRGACLVLVIALVTALVVGRTAHAQSTAERIASALAASGANELALLPLDAPSADEDRAVPASETKSPCQPGILPAGVAAAPVRIFSGIAACEQGRMPPTREVPPPLGPPRQPVT